MDTSEYLPMFLAESREHLQELNLAVLKIEENPEDKEKIDEIFRVAHSMKGMSATMGFAAMAELTHKMEDVFELLRQRRGGLSRDAIDAVLACLDMLEGGVANIDEHGEERLDPAGPLGTGAVEELPEGQVLRRCLLGVAPQAEDAGPALRDALLAAAVRPPGQPPQRPPVPLDPLPEKRAVLHLDLGDESAAAHQ